MIGLLLWGCSDDRPPGGSGDGGGGLQPGNEGADEEPPNEGGDEGAGETPEYDWRSEGEGELNVPPDGDEAGGQQGGAEQGGADQGGAEEGGGEGDNLDAAVEVAPRVIDFGFLAEGVVASRAFSVTAISDVEVTVEEVSLTWDSSRDFSLIAGPELPTLVTPGESAQFVVAYSQSGESGDEGAIWIRTDSEVTPDLSVRLLARRKEGPADIHVEPREIPFGRRAVGLPAPAFVSILNVGGMPLAVQGLTFDPAGGPFTLAEAVEPFELEAGGSRRVEVVYTPPAEGEYAGDLVITSDDPNEREVRVHLTGEAPGDTPPCLLISPNPLRFGSVRRGDERVRSAELISCGAQPLTIARLDRGQLFGIPLSDEFTITAEPGWPQVLAAGQRANVEITYSPRLAGPDFGHFVVRNDSPAPAAQLELQAIGLPPLLGDVALHIQLEWNSDDCDVDLHLLRPGGQFFDCDTDCFYQNPAPDWGRANDFHDDPFLDIDNVSGFGPENINVEEPEAGVFRVIIHYYLDSYHGEIGPGISVETDATVRIFVRGQMVLEETRHLDHTDRTWDVAEIDWPAGDIRPIHNLYEFNRANIPACLGFFRP